MMQGIARDPGFFLTGRAQWARGWVKDVVISHRGLVPASKLVISGQASYALRGQICDAALACCHILWLLDREKSQLIAFDLENGRVDRRLNLELPRHTVCAIGVWDDQLLLATKDKIHVYAIRQDTTLATFAMPPDTPAVVPGCVVTSHPRGFFLPAAGGGLWQVTPSGGWGQWSAPLAADYRIHALCKASKGRLIALLNNGVKQQLVRYGPDWKTEIITDLAVAFPDAGLAGIACDRHDNIYSVDTAFRGPHGESAVVRLRPGSSNWEIVALVAHGVLQLRASGAGYLAIIGHTQISVLKLSSHYGEGTYLTPVFDSRGPATQWHDFQFESELPPGTELRVSWAASERRAALQPGACAWSKPLVNPPRGLIRAAAGRYLRLRLQLIGNAEAAPRVRALKIGFPRTGWQAFLPAIYHRDSDHVSTRFIALLEAVFNQLRDQIDQLPSCFEPAVASGTHLRWLASWLGLPQDTGLHDGELKILMRFAPHWYRKRGSAHGMLNMARAFLRAVNPSGVWPWQPILSGPVLIERHRFDGLKDSDVPALDRVYGHHGNCFCLLLDPAMLPGARLRAILKRLISWSKPAHCDSQLALLPYAMRPGDHLYLGLNTRLIRTGFKLGADRASVSGREKPPPVLGFNRLADNLAQPYPAAPLGESRPKIEHKGEG